MTLLRLSTHLLPRKGRLDRLGNLVSLGSLVSLVSLGNLGSLVNLGSLGSLVNQDSLGSLANLVSLVSLAGPGMECPPQAAPKCLTSEAEVALLHQAAATTALW